MNITKTKPQIKVRNSSFELLRIISMVLIIMHHYAYKIGTDYITPFSGNFFFLQTFYMFGKLGVNLFVFISGYFLCSKEFHLSKLIKLEIQVVFYSFFITLIFQIILTSGTEKKLLIESLFPLFTFKYWFYNTYFVLYLLFPFLNIFIRNTSKKCFSRLIIILLFIWTILPIFPKIHPLEKSNLGWFILLYFSGAYIKKYNSDFRHKAIYYINLSLALTAILLLQVCLFDILGTKEITFRKNFDYFQPMNSIFMFSIAVLLFIAFSKINFYCKFINKVGNTTFGIYLIHNQKLVSNFLWGGVFNFYSKIDAPSLIPFSFIAILAVFTICSIIEFLRNFAEQKIIKLYKKIKHN